MTKLIVEIPEDVTEALRLPPGEQEGELRKELALALYQRGALPLGKARRLAGLDRWEFDRLLGRRKIVRHYTEDDLRDDLRYAEGRQ
jgi:predicted HTH domain antitoxin